MVAGRMVHVCRSIRWLVASAGFVRIVRWTATLRARIVGRELGTTRRHLGGVDRAMRPFGVVRGAGGSGGRVEKGPDRVRRPPGAARPVRSIAVVPPAHRRLTPRRWAGAAIVTAAPERRGKVEDIDSAMGTSRTGPSSDDDTAVGWRRPPPTRQGGTATGLELSTPVVSQR
jgi:hypothetical protein